MAGKNRIVIKESANKQRYAVVKSPNNKTIAHTETYKTQQGVNNAIGALKKIIKNAEVIDQTRKVSMSRKK
jgi:uncharacterized protein YegP (UPF0339 family)